MSTRVKVRHHTRSARRRRELLLRSVVWVFLFIFAMSVVGGIGLFAAGTFGH